MPVTLTGTQLEDILDALADATDYRWTLGNQCGRCEAGLCDDHAADVRKGIRYANLARQLCKAVPHG